MSISYNERCLYGQKSHLSKQIPYDIGIIELNYSCGLLKNQHSHCNFSLRFKWA